MEMSGKTYLVAFFEGSHTCGKIVAEKSSFSYTLADTPGFFTITVERVVGALLLTKQPVISLSAHVLLPSVRPLSGDLLVL